MPPNHNHSWNPSKVLYEDDEKYCTRQPNLNYALRGLDLPSLNPMFGNDPDGSGEVSEPGIRLQIFEDKGSFIQAIEQLTCTASVDENFYSNFEDLINGHTHMSSDGHNLQVGQEISIEVPVEGISFGTTIPPLFTRGTSGSDDSSSIHAHFDSEQGSVANTRAVCGIYRVDIDIRDRSLTLHPGFIDAILRLDDASKGNSVQRKAEAKKFVETYGTHYASKTIMGTSFTMETSYNAAETQGHSEAQLKECHSKSALRVFGMQLGKDTETCEGSLSDTTIGEDTAVKRFSATFIGTFPAAGGGEMTLEEWSQQLQEMWKDKTLSPLPLKRSMEPIVNIFFQDAVHGIIHPDGEPINVLRILNTLMPFYGEYCEQMGGDCSVGCTENLFLRKDNEILWSFSPSTELPSYHGRRVYQSAETPRSYLYYGTSGWLVSPNIGSLDDEILFKTAECPQIGGAFVGGIPIYNTKDFETCATTCQDSKDCNFWQWNNITLTCHIAPSITGYNEEPNTYSGGKNCPALGLFQTLFTLCPELGANSHMWIHDNKFYDPSITLGGERCHDPWFSPEENAPCYLMSREPENWFQADEHCKKLGGFLAEIRSPKDQENIERFIDDGAHYLIGMTDLAHQGKFVWMNDFSEPDYTNWAPDQPNNNGGNQHCVMLNWFDQYPDNTLLGKWNDGECDRAVDKTTGKEYHALCQK